MNVGRQLGLSGVRGMLIFIFFFFLNFQCTPIFRTHSSFPGRLFHIPPILGPKPRTQPSRERLPLWWWWLLWERLPWRRALWRLLKLEGFQFAHTTENRIENRQRQTLAVHTSCFSLTYIFFAFTCLRYPSFMIPKCTVFYPFFLVGIYLGMRYPPPSLSIVLFYLYKNRAW